MSDKYIHGEKSSCPLAKALDVVGDRWTLLLLRDMLFYGKHEFREFLASAEGISTNILADRLKKLATAGILASFPHPQDRKRKFYYLTGKGKSLIHPLMALVRWSRRHLPDTYLSPEAAMELENNPEGMIRKALLLQERWEAEHLRS